MNNIKPKCINCLVRDTSTNYIKNGKTHYRKLCEFCISTSKLKTEYRFHKKSYCERCGFIPEIPNQLDVDHIDGNKKNDNPENFQTLCANCHRLKTYQDKNWNRSHLR